MTPHRPHGRLFLLILGLAFLAQSPLFALDLIISNLQGTVEIQKKNQTTWQKAQAGVILKTGDRIRTGRRSRAHTISQEGHKVTIKEKTVLEISKLGPLEWEFNQEKGRVKLKVAKLASNQSLRVKTPTALCAVRGTEFEVTVMEDRSTVLDVFEGLVGFSEPQAAQQETFVAENQRSAIQEGAPQPKPAEAMPEEKVKEHQREKIEEQKQEQRQQNAPQEKPGEPKDPKNEPKNDPKADPKAEPRDPKVEPRESKERMEKSEQTGFRPAGDSFRQEINREINSDLQRDSAQSEASFENQANQYQEGKSLIDAFGQRVRLEEYLTRPNPETFKIISISKRDARVDSAVFEVTANKALPENLDSVGNLWASLGPNKPEFYAVKQRWQATNGQDTVGEIALDGDSRQVNFLQPIFSDTGQFLGDVNQVGYQTVFDHRYEFINGNPGATERLWTDPSFRPLDNGLVSGTQVGGMMWHARPILVENFDPANNKVTASFWQEAFVAGGNGSTGKMFVMQRFPDPNPYLAHNTARRSYINFTDTNGNGIADKGEEYTDFNSNGIHDTNEPFRDVVQVGLNGTRDTSRAFTSGRDTLFSDLNRNGIDDDGVTGTDPFAVAQRAWAWQVNEEFILNDLGKIVNYQDAGFGALGQGSQDQNIIADSFEKFNYQRTFVSSEFGGRKIDVVITPRTLLKAGIIGTKTLGQNSFDPNNH